jgi:hypothetical protein
MRLDVRTALTGEPGKGDMVDLKLADGRSLVIGYEPHGSFDHYEWRVWQVDPLDEATRLFAELDERGIESKWVTCYIEHGWDVAVGQPLALVLVPRGNMYEWPRAMTDSAIADIVIR